MWWPFGSAYKPNRRLPRSPRRPTSILTASRRPSYHRPSASPDILARGQRADAFWRERMERWSLKPQWLALSAVAHILLLGGLATVMLSSSTSQRLPQLLPIRVNQAQAPPRVVVAPAASVNTQEPKAKQPPVDTSLVALRQFRATTTEQTSQLERKFVELSETLATKAETIARQQQQLATAQQESARLTEELAARTAAEQEIEKRFAEEQASRAKVEAELAEQQRRYEAALRGQQEAYHTLLADLQGEIARKDVTIREFTDRLSINIVDRVLFPSGQATLTPEGKRVLETIGQVLAKVTDRRVQIEGHTDSQEIGPGLKKLFASNWELSTARATEVVRYLLAHVSIPTEHISAVGRADTVPVASNATEAGRQLNRRIEILLLPLTQPIQAEHSSKDRPG